MAWRIFYRNNFVYSNEDGPPESAPKSGVQGIVIPEGIIEKRDFYWWADETWWGGDLWGRIQYELEPGFKLVLLGQSDHDEAYKETIKRMIIARTELLEKES